MADGIWAVGRQIGKGRLDPPMVLTSKFVHGRLSHIWILSFGRWPFFHSTEGPSRRTGIPLLVLAVRTYIDHIVPDKMTRSHDLMRRKPKGGRSLSFHAGFYDISRRSNFTSRPVRFLAARPQHPNSSRPRDRRPVGGAPGAARKDLE